MSKLFRGEAVAFGRLEACQELLVVLQTLQGRTKSFQARLGAPWQELSGLEAPKSLLSSRLLKGWRHVEDPRKARVTCLSNVANGASALRSWFTEALEVLKAVGWPWDTGVAPPACTSRPGRGGLASRRSEAQGASSWRQVAELEVSHHDWESVRLAVLSAAVPYLSWPPVY